MCGICTLILLLYVLGLMCLSSGDSDTLGPVPFLCRGMTTVLHMGTPESAWYWLSYNSPATTKILSPCCTLPKTGPICTPGSISMLGTLPDLEEVKPAAPVRQHSLCRYAACTKAVPVLAVLILCSVWRPLQWPPSCGLWSSRTTSLRPAK